MRSPTITIPVAMPTRTWSGAPADVSSFGAASTIASSGPHGPFGVVLVRTWIAEIGEHAVAHIFADEAAVDRDQTGAAFVISGDGRVYVLGIKPRGERRRTYEVAEHECELAALGGRGRRGACRLRWTDRRTENGDRLE